MSLPTVTEEPEEAGEPQIEPFPRRRPRVARIMMPSTGASPRLIDPVMKSSPNDPDEFTHFLSPYLMRGDKVLHIGCQGGAVTFELSRMVSSSSSGHVVGISSPGQDTRRARMLAQRTNRHDDAVTFLDITDLSMLPFMDNTFDVVYASDIMAYLPPHPEHESVVNLLTEMKRVAKLGGIVATRDLTVQHFFPNNDLINMVTRVIFQAAGLPGWYGPLMPQLYTSAGIHSQTLFCSTSTPDGSATGDHNWAEALAARFARGTDLRSKWIKAGVREDLLNLISIKLKQWGKIPFSWYVCLYTEIVGQKEESLVSSDSPGSSPPTTNPTHDDASDSESPSAEITSDMDPDNLSNADSVPDSPIPDTHEA